MESQSVPNRAATLDLRRTTTVSRGLQDEVRVDAGCAFYDDQTLLSEDFEFVLDWRFTELN